MPRIHITGAPGAGKTTYARKLAKQKRLPLYHLDEIYHDNSGGVSRKRTEPERMQVVAEIVKKRSYITEGTSFSDWINPLLERATEIHVVSPSRVIRVWRQIKRFMRRKLGFEHSTYRETLSGLWHGIKWTWRYERDTMPIIRNKIPQTTPIYKIQCNNRIEKDKQ